MSVCVYPLGGRGEEVLENHQPFPDWLQLQQEERKRVVLQLEHHVPK